MVIARLERKLELVLQFAKIVQPGPTVALDQKLVTTHAKQALMLDLDRRSVLHANRVPIQLSEPSIARSAKTAESVNSS